MTTADSVQIHEGFQTSTRWVFTSCQSCDSDEANNEQQLRLDFKSSIEPSNRQWRSCWSQVRTVVLWLVVVTAGLLNRGVFVFLSGCFWRTAFSPCKTNKHVVSRLHLLLKFFLSCLCAESTKLLSVVQDAVASVSAGWNHQFWICQTTRWDDLPQSGVLFQRCLQVLGQKRQCFWKL